VPGAADLVGDLHITAVEALLTPLGHPVYISEVTGDDATREHPYLVLHPDAGTVTFDDLAWHTADYRSGWQITAVGRDRRECQAAADRARAALVAVRPVVTGRICGLITQVDGVDTIRQDPAVRDPATQRPVFYAAVQYTLSSRPA
jgi:hypothetical protein